MRQTINLGHVAQAALATQILLRPEAEEYRVVTLPGEVCPRCAALLSPEEEEALHSLSSDADSGERALAAFCAQCRPRMAECCDCGSEEIGSLSRWGSPFRGNMVAVCHSCDDRRDE
ncbi:MAG: hypothetical protein KGL39_15940 [Patescibacteria group bacterium]|nr:hypothetical protein [Patescibacteria group bacterium]